MQAAPEGWGYEGVFDGGDDRCGDFLLDLFVHFKPLAPGARVLVTVRGAAAPTEIPTWCRLTGHRLVAAMPPHYLIERRPG